MIRNESLLGLIKTDYSASDIQKLTELLEKEGTFRFARFKNGLFPAAGFDAEKFAETGYQNVWVRDNCWVAYAHYVTGKSEVAVKNVEALMRFFKKHQTTFLHFIRGEVDTKVLMNRPHIRFNGRHMTQLKEQWTHAQNDALGYFVWLYSLLVLDDLITPSPKDLEILACFVLFFEAVAYWQDEDNGHWEEKRKIEASSIGVVVGALKMLKRLVEKFPKGTELPLEGRIITPELLEELIGRGEKALKSILPSECVQPGSLRRYDAALLFLIYPMAVVSEGIADRIIQNVTRHLQGDYGIRRYLADSYWATDYKKHLAANKRSIIYSEDTTKRDAIFQHTAEAQWCIFDPILSIIYGLRYQKSHKKSDLHHQITYLNRSLGQLTGPKDPSGPFRCPELYCLESNHYKPNDHTPLLWTQGNLLMALQVMEENAVI